MANITGTQGKDTLTGTAGDDTIHGLGGNDRIIASGGNDTIDGGAGNDVLDYSAVDVIGIDLIGSTEILKSGGSQNGRDAIVGFETIIAKPDGRNSIGVGYSPNSVTTLNVDLSKNRATYSDATSSKTFTVKNFNQIYGGDGNDRLKGDNRDNDLSGGAGNDLIIGSQGNDNLFAGGGNDTLDYSNIGRPVKLSASWYVENLPRQGDYVFSSMNANKGDFGTDNIGSLLSFYSFFYPNNEYFLFHKIIAPTNKENTLDFSANNNIASIDVNLANNSLKVNIPNNSQSNPDILLKSKTQQFELINFVDVIGTKNNDTIVGANKNSKLTGGGGNDTICGGNKNDRITGTDSNARGVGEVDKLTGGGGRDKFILGDKNGAYYVGHGSNDYALITDFNIFQDSISVGNLKNYSFALEGNNTIDLFSGKDVNHRDLIAKIQIAGGISSVSHNSKSIVGADSSLNEIVSKLDILSGSESERDS